VLFLSSFTLRLYDHRHAAIRDDMLDIGVQVH
jgi:hypothetical protein